ncbi:unnamed protein product [Rangifer tarandus platyrhynchus]|uniref:Uncharacterized protein n=2 Tax=Rangifer tarandus platyrhynchus TaxID=3082113 RepID=A0ABN8ZM39_RANTA|nr:unnamed protein product [Rangifer tarandus platyrhynchus]
MLTFTTDRASSLQIDYFLLNGVGPRLRPLSLGPDSIAAWILLGVLLGAWAQERDALDGSATWGSFVGFSSFIFPFCNSLSVAPRCRSILLILSTWSQLWFEKLGEEAGLLLGKP